MAEGLNVFPAVQGVNLNIASVNLPDATYRAQYRVVDPKELAYTTDAGWWSDRDNLLSAPEGWPDAVLDSVPKNELQQTPVPIQEQLGGPTGMLAYGVGADALDFVDNQGQPQTWKPAYSGLVQLTNLGVFAQVFPDSAVVRVHHLSDGSPAAVQIEVYEQQLNKRPADRTPKSALTPCATGNSDEEGLATLTAQDLSTCMAGEDTFTQPPELLVVVREGEDWAFARLWQYSGAWGYGFWSGWEGGEPTSRGTVFSDRQLYQPGEDAEFTAVAYSLVKGELKREANRSFDVVLRSPDGEEQALGSFTTNDYGTVAIPYRFDDKQPLGYYSIEASSDDVSSEDGVTLFGDFRVAEFKPPNFKAELQLDADIALPNDTVAASLQSNYLFGAPVDNGKVTYTVTRSRESFTPDGWDEFRFGRSWFWPEEAPTVSSEVLQIDEVLDEAGAGTQTVTVTDDLPYPMTYRFEGEVSDASNLSVSGAQTFTALPSDRLIGLKSEFVAEVEQPFDVELIVTDPEGNALDGERVTVELQKIDYKTVTQSIEGSEVARNQAEYTTVDTVRIRSEQIVSMVELTPPESGSYRIRANFTNESAETSATDLQIWVSGDEPVWWGDRGDRLELRLDKDTYKIGDTATVLVESPYANAELSLAVIRHNPLFSTIETVEGGAPQLQVQVTPDMLPNATVQVVLVRQGEPLSEVEPDSLDALSKVGFATFEVDLGDKYLEVDVNPIEESVGPGEEQTVRLVVSDRNRNPAVAQVTVMAVNEAVLQLNGYRPPDLVDIVFADQPISTRFADNRPDVELEAPASPLSKGWGYGGGLSPGGEGTRVRTDFKPLAYYGTAETDESGVAEVTFALPDDLTTWRVMVVAVARDQLQFGNGDATFIATQPLLANPILPQFARLGDTFDVGISVTNTTGESGQLQVSSQLGLPDEVVGDGTVGDAFPIQFVEGDAATTSLSDSIDAGTNAYRFPVTADRVGTASIQFDTQLNDFGDAFRVPLEIQNLPVAEQTVETGTTSDRVEIPVSVDDTVLPNSGGLDLNLASSLLPPIVSAIPSAALGSDGIPCLEPAASRLEIAANIKRLQEQYGRQSEELDADKLDLNAIAADALVVLANLQQPDGGFAFWPGAERSALYYTPTAARSIARAIDAGIEVNDQLLSQLEDYLRQLLANPNLGDRCTSTFCKNRTRLHSLLALAELGDVRSDFLSELYAYRTNFSLVDRIELTRYLLQFPTWQAEAEDMANQLQEVVYETGRTATVNLPAAWRWMGSDARAQAEVLRLFIAQGRELEVLNRTLNGLVVLRGEDGAWHNRFDNAAVLMALVDYSQIETTPPSFTATAQLDGTAIATAQFEGYDNSNQDVSVPMADLPQGESVLELSKQGDGTLHYLSAYRYSLSGPQPGRLNGLRISREVRPANQDEVLQRFGLAIPDEPLEVAAGQVFDIGLEIIADRPVTHLVIDDPIPAGFEAVDTSFQTSGTFNQAASDSWQIDFQTIYKDRVTAYANRLSAGVYQMHYLVRSVTPGTFIWPGAEARLEYSPEEFGRSASSTLTIQ
ncbi:MAG: alpha-2-macroglobulin family protein [Cyanobacteria bacterium P01_A01_bin.3]